MKIKITYPTVEKPRLKTDRFLRMTKWVLLLAAILCPIINIAVQGKAWSLIVLMSIYTVWTLVLSPDLVEYNRISQSIKLITCSCILLCLIDYFLVPGWAIEVVPIVCFCGLATSGVMFFTDIDRQKQNMLPILLLIFLAIAGSIIGLCLWHGEGRWSLIVMGNVAVFLLIVCIVALRKDFLRELQRRFHV